MPNRRCKSETVERQASIRKSPRTKPKVTEVTDKTPKRTRRKAIKFNMERPKFSDSESSDSFSTPNKSSRSRNGGNEKVCSFYKTGSTPSGAPTFSKALINYFMKIDSPEMEDLRLKRFNTSFLHETPRNRDSLRIFTPEEDMDKKWLENVPEVNSAMPDIPGTEHADVFAKIPMLNGDSDEEFKLKLAGIKKEKSLGKQRKSTRCTQFKGKPLPDQSLLIDYTSLLYDSSWDGAENNSDESEKVDEKNNGILFSLLSSPSNKPIRPKNGANSLRTKEDEMLLSKYKDSRLKSKPIVMLTKLPIDSRLSKSSMSKKVKAKSVIDYKGKKKVSNTKGNAGKKVKVSRPGSSSLLKTNESHITY